MRVATRFAMALRHEQCVQLGIHCGASPCRDSSWNAPIAENRLAVYLLIVRSIPAVLLPSDQFQLAGSLSGY